MDASNPAPFVNGGLLRQFVGRKVRTVVQILRSDAGSIVGKSTDDQQIIVKGASPLPPSGFVEVIGIAENNQSIRAEICTSFGDSFDAYSYNQLCQLANGEFRHLFI